MTTGTISGVGLEDLFGYDRRMRGLFRKDPLADGVMGIIPFSMPSKELYTVPHNVSGIGRIDQPSPQGGVRDWLVVIPAPPAHAMNGLGKPAKPVALIGLIEDILDHFVPGAVGALSQSQERK